MLWPLEVTRSCRLRSFDSSIRRPSSGRSPSSSCPCLENVTEGCMVSVFGMRKSTWREPWWMLSRR